jgi:hypothetical protein
MGPWRSVLIRSVVVSRSLLSRLLAQKGHPSTKRACLRKPRQQQA